MLPRLIGSRRLLAGRQHGIAVVMERCRGSADGLLEMLKWMSVSWISRMDINSNSGLNEFSAVLGPTRFFGCRLVIDAHVDTQQIETPLGEDI